MDLAQKKFELIVKSFSADMYRYAFWLCRDRAMADDLVQETFLRAWRSLDSLRDEKKAKSWLITTLRREHARQYERYQPEFQDQDLEQLPSRANDQGLDPEVLALRRAVADLPEKYREPLVLQALMGYSGDEVSEILGLPRATVMTRLFRARQKLRRILDGTDDTNIEPLFAQ